ncbi:MAG: FAD-dependent oxidoreductase [Actinobacteria bacterium]|nr:FAD-dependent oxidoreductase [Actinomycetota bacterium]
MEQENVSINLSLISSHDEVENVRTFIFEKKSVEWVAGQSQAYILPQAGETEKENQHWFTISSAPVEGTINISTRISASPFKEALNSLNPGDEISTHSLGGKFIWEEGDQAPVTLIAAGIGITPFRSILLQRSAVGKSLNATLLYFNRTSGIPFQKELETLGQKHPEFQLKMIVGESVTAEKIFMLAPTASEQIVYLSGPAPMVSSIGSVLKEAGVTIKQDRFPGYDETNF